MSNQKKCSLSLFYYIINASTYFLSCYGEKTKKTAFNKINYLLLILSSYKRFKLYFIYKT